MRWGCGQGKSYSYVAMCTPASGLGELDCCSAIARL